MNENLKFCNGLDAEKGGYLSIEISASEISRFFRDLFSGEIGQEVLKLLDKLHAQNRQSSFPIIDEVDEGDLSQTGWAAIFPEESDPAIEEALQLGTNVKRGKNNN